MELISREYIFTSALTNEQGELATLTAEYRVEFRRNDIEDWTYIIIRPDFGPQKLMRIADCGITWKSLFYAYRWCSSHAREHLETWTELDMRYPFTWPDGVLPGNPVIPDKQLSTGPE